MRTYLKPGLALALAAGAMALSAAPASATICPGGTSPTSTNDPLLDYCVVPSAHGPNIYRSFTLALGPELYFRMDDPVGSPTMAGYGVLPDGEFKNAQDSGPIGIADDNNTAREFYGESGYGYINGIDAPNWNGFSPYGNYTMVAWIYQPTLTEGAIMQFGRGGGLYIDSSYRVVFRNGDDYTTPSAPISASQWYLVVGVKQGSSLRLFVRQSPTSPTYFTPTPQGTGTSIYRPEGQPTFYVGYSEFGPRWFYGSIDEVAYFKKALTTDEISRLFYADPPPDPSVMNVRYKVDEPTNTGPGGSASAGGGGGSSPSTGGGTFGDNSSNPGNSAAKPSKALVAARNTVKSLTKLLKKFNRELAQLKREVASRKAIKGAEKAIRDVKRQLKKAKAKVKVLEHRAKSKRPR
jgi:hypothetical protein